MSVRLYLVRHAEPAVAWGGGADDPGLSDLGRAQAHSAARALSDMAQPDVITSPLRRCRETAAAFCADPVLDEMIAEVATPAHIADRRTWLATLMAGDWADAPELNPWRNAMIARMLAIRSPTIAFTHFVAINVLAGHALGQTRVHVFSPAHASITVLESDGRRLGVASLGAETPATLL